jgi:hypothetical protein
MRLNAVQLGNITAGCLRYGRDVGIVTTEASHDHVNIPLAGATESRSGDRDVVQSSTRCAAVFMPGALADIRWRADCEQLCLMIDRDQLERELETMLGRPIPGPVEFATTMNLAANGGRRWLESVALFKREFEGPRCCRNTPSRGAGCHVRDGGRHQVGIRASEPIRLGVPGEARPVAVGDTARVMITARRFRTGRGHPPRQGD